MSVFDKTVDRRGTCSLKWDVKEGELPMWVADMDFETAPAVKEAVAERAAHGAYGYNVLPDEWYDAICSWWKDRHGTVIRRDELCFCTGAVPAISCLVKRLTNIGDEVVVMTPAYDIFFHSIENAGRHTVESPLAYDGESYAIDFDDLAEKLSRPLVRLLILCDPHNPTGNIWTKEELARIGELCKAHGVTVISDELHCDLTDPGFDYVPFASASDTCAEVSITCISASKAFNLAGLQSAAVWSRNKNLLDIAVRGLNSDELAEPNAFAAVATAAAFGKGGGWLDELRAYLAENKRLVREYVSGGIPDRREPYNGRLRVSRVVHTRKNGSVSFRRLPLPRRRQTFSAAQRRMPAFGARRRACSAGKRSAPLRRTLMTEMCELKKRFAAGGYTLMLTNGREYLTSFERGVSPLVKLLDSGRDLRGWYAADKVAGKAAAALYVLLGVSSVYAATLSESALAMLRSRGTAVSYDNVVPYIVNRSGTGLCPMEEVSKDLSEPEDILAAVRRRLRGPTS